MKVQTNNSNIRRTGGFCIIYIDGSGLVYLSPRKPSKAVVSNPKRGYKRNGEKLAKYPPKICEVCGRRYTLDPKDKYRCLNKHCGNLCDGLQETIKACEDSILKAGSTKKCAYCHDQLSRQQYDNIKLAAFDDRDRPDETVVDDYDMAEYEDFNDGDMTDYSVQNYRSNQEPSHVPVINNAGYYNQKKESYIFKQTVKDYYNDFDIYKMTTNKPTLVDLLGTDIDHKLSVGGFKSEKPSIKHAVIRRDANGNIIPEVNPKSYYTYHTNPYATRNYHPMKGDGRISSQLNGKFHGLHHYKHNKLVQFTPVKQGTFVNTEYKINYTKINLVDWKHILDQPQNKHSTWLSMTNSEWYQGKPRQPKGKGMERFPNGELRKIQSWKYKSRPISPVIFHKNHKGVNNEAFLYKSVYFTNEYSDAWTQKVDELLNTGGHRNFDYYPQGKGITVGIRRNGFDVEFVKRPCVKYTTRKNKRGYNIVDGKIVTKVENGKFIAKPLFTIKDIRRHHKGGYNGELMLSASNSPNYGRTFYYYEPDTDPITPIKTTVNGVELSDVPIRPKKAEGPITYTDRTPYKQFFVPKKLKDLPGWQTSTIRPARRKAISKRNNALNQCILNSMKLETIGWVKSNVTHLKPLPTANDNSQINRTNTWGYRKSRFDASYKPKYTKISLKPLPKRPDPIHGIFDPKHKAISTKFTTAIPWGRSENFRLTNFVMIPPYTYLKITYINLG